MQRRNIYRKINFNNSPPIESCFSNNTYFQPHLFIQTPFNNPNMTAYFSNSNHQNQSININITLKLNAQPALPQMKSNTFQYQFSNVDNDKSFLSTQNMNNDMLLNNTVCFTGKENYDPCNISMENDISNNDLHFENTKTLSADCTMIDCIQTTKTLSADCNMIDCIQNTNYQSLHGGTQVAQYNNQPIFPNNIQRDYFNNSFSDTQRKIDDQMRFDLSLRSKTNIGIRKDKGKRFKL